MLNDYSYLASYSIAVSYFIRYSLAIIHCMLLLSLTELFKLSSGRLKLLYLYFK